MNKFGAEPQTTTASPKVKFVPLHESEFHRPEALPLPGAPSFAVVAKGGLPRPFSSVQPLTSSLQNRCPILCRCRKGWEPLLLSCHPEPSAPLLRDHGEGPAFAVLWCVAQISAPLRSSAAFCCPGKSQTGPSSSQSLRPQHPPRRRVTPQRRLQSTPYGASTPDKARWTSRAQLRTTAQRSHMPI